MGRTVAVIWHASFSVAAGVLYFFFVLPRHPELVGTTSHTLGTWMRIIAGALIGLAALPVVFTLLRTRRPELGTPALALGLRTTSIVLHVLAGVLVIGTAVSEIWLTLDAAGQWLFGIYGAAAAVAVLGIAAFYLAFTAELPPPPPKPLKVKERRSRGRSASREADATEDAQDTDAATEAGDGDTAIESDEPAPTVAESADNAEATEVAEPSDAEAGAGDTPADAPDSALRNRRPAGKGSVLGRRRRSRGGVALDD